jgi:hypothetical protein
MRYLFALTLCSVTLACGPNEEMIYWFPNTDTGAPIYVTNLGNIYEVRNSGDKEYMVLVTQVGDGKKITSVNSTPRGRTYFLASDGTRYDITNRSLRRWRNEADRLDGFRETTVPNLNEAIDEKEYQELQKSNSAK